MGLGVYGARWYQRVYWGVGGGWGLWRKLAIWGGYQVEDNHAMPAGIVQPDLKGKQ